MKLFFLLAVIFTLSSFAIKAIEHEGQIYRWVDKNGVVHYADKPNNKNAALVHIKNAPSNSAIESNIELPKLNNQPDEKSDDLVLSEEDQQYCDYIREQIKLAKEAVEMGNELRAEYASAYIMSSDKLLKENRCI